jgi:phosphoribosylformylglycinamidine (FGAM) synthase PurS component
MGACEFTESADAGNVREAFEGLCEDARYEAGHDSYNGTISTCSLGRCKMKFDTYTKANEEKARKIIEKDGYGQKWVADYIDLGVVCYDVVTVKKKNTQYNAKYKQQFVVCDEASLNPVRNYHYDTKPMADEKAMELTLQASGSADFIVRKMMVKLLGNDVVSRFMVEKKSYGGKPKLNPMKNRKIIEIHRYLFYGLASC